MEANPPTTTIDISEAWHDCEEKDQNLQNREREMVRCRRKGGVGGGPSTVSSKKKNKKKNLSPYILMNGTVYNQ